MIKPTQGFEHKLHNQSWVLKSALNKRDTLKSKMADVSEGDLMLPSKVKAKLQAVESDSAQSLEGVTRGCAG